MSIGARSVASPIASATATQARRWRIGGRVQGVGFRPFVFHLAHSFALTGWVRNSGGEVVIYAQGPTAQLQAFGQALLTRAPPAAHPRLIESQPDKLNPSADFRILASALDLGAHGHVPTDLFTCEDCLSELRDAASRRYRYPFINCTQCGPRYSLIRALPYDRANTTLECFALCQECATEYADPNDRRFHAEPLACAACGPALYWQDDAHKLTGNEIALAAALSALRRGQIVALRGIGGYHLVCDAGNERAVARLRTRKRRPSKPLALMVPWRGQDGLDYVRSLVALAPAQATALCGAVRPIMIAERRANVMIAASAAPGLRQFALMLPYSPLHHLLLEEFGAALVVTSANLSGEPVLTEPQDVQSRLADVADGYLHHDRPIAHPADDPIVRMIAGVVRPVRLGRGSAPLELNLPMRMQVPTLAVGAYMKITVALAWEDRAVVSPHIGELGSPSGRQVFAQVIQDLQQLYGVQARHVVHDAHPDFPNTRWARESGLSTQSVWHHHAHAAAVAGEYPSEAPLLCFTWDGVGVGPDQTLWGGEGLLGRPGAWTRVASFRPFRLPGGERAARQPWRSALALCWESDQQWHGGTKFGDPLLRAAFDGNLNAPSTTAVGRLFDAAAALLGICTTASYEGEAPIRLEALCSDVVVPVSLPLACDSMGIWRSDWAPLVPAMLDENRSIAIRAAIFHESLAQALCEQAIAVREQSGVARIGLSGGVFQNCVLTHRVQALLTVAGFEVLIPQQLPVNDAGISFGQLIEAAAQHDAHI